MNNDVIESLENYATNLLKNTKEEITEEILAEAVNKFVYIEKMTKGINDIDKEVAQAIANLEKRYAITMDTGSILKGDNYNKWYQSSKAERGTAYWDRYNRYLKDTLKMPEAVVNKIDDSAEEIMDGLGDPLSDSAIQRKGLVIGAVQSGKTSNYIALMNKAADSGYKVIILLTGTIEKLRQQTQGRVDEGFVGVDSKQKQEKKSSKAIGSGLYNGDIQVVSFTTTAKDFNLKNENVPLKSIADPVVFVVKKNKSILEKLKTWLSIKNANEATGKIDMPLLIIDDEADNASINTNNADKNPTAINNEIRELLKLFTKYSYVGFTATPFANIFIDPQLDEKIKEDLFPKDFIYLLEQPSNYVGPNSMYNEDGEHHYMIRFNDDLEELLPLKHKKDEFLSYLPNSLKKAVLLFFLANGVRDIRGDKKKHRSMLIHVSRFIAVQNDVREKIANYTRSSKEYIKNYILSDEEHPFINSLKTLFEKEYKEGPNQINESWEDVKNALYKAVSPIQVRTINSGVAAKEMNYDEHEDGLRLIAVGGLSLARGLTLEGLMTSYFYRNTKMYDTLMQMGRWFGYRDNYADLCRLWTSEESAEWYAHIASATEELRFEIKKMANQNMKPIDFGLRVKSANDTPLIITAKNKMKNTETIKLNRSLNGRVLETAILTSDNKDNKANYEVIETFLLKNKKYYINDLSNYKRQKPLFKNLPKEEIIDLLQLLKFPYMNELSTDETFVKDLKNSKSKILNSWDVAIATNKEKNANVGRQLLAGIEIHPIERSFDLYGTSKYIRLSKSKKRLGSTEYAQSGLEIDVFNEIDKSIRNILSIKSKGNQKKNATENMYFNTGVQRNPLLVIYPIQLKKDEKGDSEINKVVSNQEELIIGISVGIPDIKGVENITYNYTVNVVYQRELIEGTSVSSEWDNECEEEDTLEELNS